MSRRQRPPRPAPHDYTPDIDLLYYRLAIVTLRWQGVAPTPPWPNSWTARSQSCMMGPLPHADLSRLTGSEHVASRIAVQPCPVSAPLIAIVPCGDRYVPHSLALHHYPSGGASTDD